jgi:hypothetical protein
MHVGRLKRFCSWNCSEGVPEEVELKELGRRYDVYEETRWPLGIEPG